MPFSWKTIKKPVVALAPMSGVTDIAARSVARKWGSDITFSEFISTDALYYKVKSLIGKDPLSLSDKEMLHCAQDDAIWADDKSCRLAEFIEEERPFIIQLFGPTPEHFSIAAKILKHRFNPDGFDINFGCPARSVINNGAGSCLFLNPEAAKKIVTLVKEAANLPTSIKLRASYKHVTALDFLQAIKGAPFENVTVHMRTYEQVHHGQPNWDIGKQVKEFFKDTDVTVLINGGIDSGEKAKQALQHTGADGVMVAQSSLGNPFIFAEIKSALEGKFKPEINLQTRIQTIMDQAHLVYRYKGDRGMLELRKHLLWYFKGFPNASELRKELSQVNSLEQLDGILKNISILA